MNTYIPNMKALGMAALTDFWSSPDRCPVILGRAHRAAMTLRHVFDRRTAAARPPMHAAMQPPMHDP